MVSLKKVLTLLFISTASALPADFCLIDSEAASFRFNSCVCDCYNGTVSAVVTPDASAPWTWYDMLCGSANKLSLNIELDIHLK
ncbi:hypothetical protein BFJ70_g3067 [Fusarium oxysporum]|nr:hypothetical protein BFJ70_g3067 [Fusarium oxysporum]